MERKKIISATDENFEVEFENIRNKLDITLDNGIIYLDDDLSILCKSNNLKDCFYNKDDDEWYVDVDDDDEWFVDENGELVCNTWITFRAIKDGVTPEEKALFCNTIAEDKYIKKYTRPLGVDIAKALNWRRRTTIFETYCKMSDYVFTLLKKELDIEFSQEIVHITNGNALVMPDRNLLECFNIFTCGIAEWYIDENRDLRSKQRPLDKTEDILYRVFKDGVSEEQKQYFNGDEVTQDDIEKYTTSLGDNIGKFYKWETDTIYTPTIKIDIMGA